MHFEHPSHRLQYICESPEYGLQVVLLKFSITGAVFHVRPSFGLIYRHPCLLLISLGARQNWHLPCHIPFVSQHVLQHTLSSFSVELFLRCRTMHSWMASCLPNGTKINNANNADKRRGIEKVTSPICNMSSCCGYPQVFPQSRRNTMTKTVDGTIPCIYNFTCII